MAKCRGHDECSVCYQDGRAGGNCLQLAARMKSEREIPRHYGAGTEALARGQDTWRQVPALPLSGPVTLDKSLTLSEPQFSLE